MRTKKDVDFLSHIIDAALATRNLGVQLTLTQPGVGGQIMPTTLLLAHPDLKT